MKNQGIFLISIDFELYWGVRDKRSISDYSSNLEGTPCAIEDTLELFQLFGVHATWATVGFIFFRDQDHLRQNLPEILPHYDDSVRNPYIYILESDNLDQKYHFAPQMIDLIQGYVGQEIGTHTFSHYYCLEPGQDREAFKADLEAAIKIANQRNLSIHSLVFPRNQWNPDYISILAELGITAYRGNESSVLYTARGHERYSIFMRAGRLLDSYLNLTGYHTCQIAEIASAKPYNIPASRFLRPYWRTLGFLDNLRLKRITSAMTHAARNGLLFHLWWHPHNFGINTGKNLVFLEKILQHFKLLNHEFGMQTLNMKEVSDLLDSTP